MKRRIVTAALALLIAVGATGCHEMERQRCSRTLWGCDAPGSVVKR